MAEGILKKILNEKNRKDVEVYSAGVYAETGVYATDKAIAAAKDIYNVDILKHRATNVRDSKIKEMDIILCATYSHKVMVQHLYPEIADKVYTMKEYANGIDTKDKDIKDPWGYTMQVYINCVKEIYEVILEIINKI